MPEGQMPEGQLPGGQMPAGPPSDRTAVGSSQLTADTLTMHEELRDGLSVTISIAIEEKEDFFESIFAELVKLRDNWGFKLFRRYEIVATVWGTEGAYEHEDGVILLRVNREGRRTSAYGEPLEHTVVHEVVHIGIEEVIVRRYSLGHDMKEFLVDAICSIYLKELMPEYESQVDFRGMEVPKYDVIKGDLPGFIERPRARRPQTMYECGWREYR